MLAPRRLARGSRIAVVAPASPFRQDDFDNGIAELERIGLVPVWDGSVFARQAYVAGSAAVRAAAPASPHCCTASSKRMPASASASVRALSTTRRA